MSIRETKKNHNYINQAWTHLIVILYRQILRERRGGHARRHLDEEHVERARLLRASAAIVRIADRQVDGVRVAVEVRTYRYSHRYGHRGTVRDSDSASTTVAS